MLTEIQMGIHQRKRLHLGGLPLLPVKFHEMIPDEKKSRPIMNNNEILYKVSFYTCTLLSFVVRCWLLNHPAEVV